MSTGLVAEATFLPLRIPPDYLSCKIFKMYNNPRGCVPVIDSFTQSLQKAYDMHEVVFEA